MLLRLTSAVSLPSWSRERWTHGDVITCKRFPHCPFVRMQNCDVSLLLAWKSCWTKSRIVPSHWETSSQSDAVTHWLGASLESALYTYLSPTGLPSAHFWSACHNLLPLHNRPVPIDQYVAVTWKMTPSRPCCHSGSSLNLWRLNDWSGLCLRHCCVYTGHIGQLFPKRTIMQHNNISPTTTM